MNCGRILIVSMTEMRESKNNTILNQYLRETRMYCYYELKVARGPSFSFSKIEEGQKTGLPALQKEGLVWKFSDEDSRIKPCDGGCFPPLPTFLVIKFGMTFYFILYEKIQDMMGFGEKSIKEEDARAISTRIVHT